MEHKPVPITARQYRLLASPLRLRILHLLADSPKTVKQAADILGETRGNVHYHIKKLLSGSLIELVDTRQVGGIVEKYYRSRSTRFTTADTEPKTGVMRLATWVDLTAGEAEELLQQVEVVLSGWEKRLPPDDAPRLQYEVQLEVRAKKLPSNPRR